MNFAETMKRWMRGTETRWVWNFLIWFAISDIALALIIDRLPEKILELYIPITGLPIIVWMGIHYVVNPFLACLVAVTVTMRAIRSRKSSALITALVSVPVLFLIAYLGFTKNGQWLELWGLAMRDG